MKAVFVFCILRNAENKNCRRANNNKAGYRDNEQAENDNSIH